MDKERMICLPNSEVVNKITDKFGPIPEFGDREHCYWISLLSLDNNRFQLGTLNSLINKKPSFIDYTLIDPNTKTIARREEGNMEKINFWSGQFQLRYRIAEHREYDAKEHEYIPSKSICVDIGFVNKRRPSISAFRHRFGFDRFTTISFERENPVEPSVKKIDIYMPTTCADNSLDNITYEMRFIIETKTLLKQGSMDLLLPYQGGRAPLPDEINSLKIGDVFISEPMVYRVDINSGLITILKRDNKTGFSDTLSFPHPQKIDLDGVIGIMEGQNWEDILKNFPIKYSSSQNVGLERQNLYQLEGV